MSSNPDSADTIVAVLQADIAALRQQVAEQQQAIQEARADAERYRTIADYTSNCEYWVDAAGNFAYVSPVCERITGYQPEAFQADPHLLEAIIHPDDQAQMHDHVHDTNHLSGIHEATFRIITRSGEERWIAHICQKVYDAQGQFLGRRASNQDITARMLVEKQLYHQVQLFTNLINTLPFPVFYKDADGIYRGCNRMFAEDVLGMQSDVVVGKDVFDLIPAPEASLYHTLDAKLFEQGGTQIYEREIIFADGIAHTVIFHKSVFHNPDDTPGGIIGAMIDITDRKQIEQALRDAYTDLEQRVAERTDTLSQVVQELHREIAEHQQTEDALRRSERRYREITDLISDSIYSVCLNADQTLTLEWGFNGLESLTGYTQDELPAQNWLQLVHPDDLHLVAQRIAQLYVGQEVESEYRLVTRSGDIRRVRDHGRPVWDEQEQRVVRIYGALKDVTLYWQTSEALRESEVRMRTLLSAIPDMVFRLDQAGVFVDFKTPRDDMLLLPSDAFLGRPYQEVLPPSLSTQLRDSIIRANRSGKVERFEYELTYADGQRYNYEARIVAGNNKHTFCVVRNISDYKQSEERIRLHAARAEALSRVAMRLNSQLELATVLHTVCEETQQALQGNMVLICLYDQHQDAVIVADGVGMPPDMISLIQPTPMGLIDVHDPVSVFYDIHQDRAIVPNMQHAESLNICSLMRALMLRDQEIVGIVLCMATHEARLFSEDEQLLIQGIAAQAAQAITNARLFATVEQERALLSRRISERTTDLIRSNEDLARAVRAKDEFLANMSHELRTPLNTILGMSEALQEQIYGTLNERQRKAMASIEQSGQHLLALINDILDLSKIESGHIELSIEPVHLSLLCQASLQFIKQQALKKDIDVSLHIDATLAAGWQDRHQPVANATNANLTIMADQRRLKQILINLLTNAVKFTPDGGKIGLDVLVDPASQMVHFNVWDTGIGINPEEQQRLFQPFIQVDSSLSREYEGTGLGLALVLRLTELHGGSVTLQSDVGVGSRFSVSLPQFGNVRPDSPSQGNLVQGTANRGDRLGVAKSNVPRSMHLGNGIEPYLPLVLLAEDNETSITTILDYLNAKGYQVVVARNGLEAIICTKEYQPSLILIDIQMPKMDGLTAIQHIRADPQLQHIPIIALTALAMRGDRERCIAAGATGYMSKPVRLKDLAQMVDEYLASLMRE